MQAISSTADTRSVTHKAVPQRQNDLPEEKPLPRNAAFCHHGVRSPADAQTQTSPANHHWGRLSLMPLPPKTKQHLVPVPFGVQTWHHSL